MPKNTKSEKVVAEVKSVEHKKSKTQKSASVEEAVEPVVVEPVVVEAEAVEPVKATKSSKKKVKAVESAVEPVVEQVAEPVVEAEEVQEAGKRRTRYFRCIYSDDVFGRFSGFKPKQAAGKALTSILRHRSKEGKELFADIEFSMIECTRGGNHKVSQYNGKRVKLDTPITVSIKTTDGKRKEINYNFTNKITKIKSEKKVVEKAEKAEKKVVKKAAKKVVAKKTVKKAKKTVKKVVAKKTTKKADA